MILIDVIYLHKRRKGGDEEREAKEKARRKKILSRIQAFKHQDIKHQRKNQEVKIERERRRDREKD